MDLQLIFMLLLVGALLASAYNLWGWVAAKRHLLRRPSRACFARLAASASCGRRAASASCGRRAASASCGRRAASASCGRRAASASCGRRRKQIVAVAYLLCWVVLLVVLLAG
jgi:hypothetical protein